MNNIPFYFISILLIMTKNIIIFHFNWNLKLVRYLFKDINLKREQEFYESFNYKICYEN